MKQYLLDYIRRPIPQGVPIVPQSIPIVFFGDIDKAKYATIAINPSNREFTNTKHEIFPTNKKRFVDRDFLGAADDETLSLEQAEMVYQSLCNFFHKRPYMQWFGQLEKLFNEADLSYFKGDIINLDISPWATSVKWSALTDEQRVGLVRHGGDLLRTILNAGQIKCLFVNGRTAMKYVEKHIAPLTSHCFIQLNASCEIKVGKIGNLTIVGWSNYLQQLRPPLSQDKRKLLVDKILELAL
ncbi:MAG: hypothetical protein FWE06_03115 [Oscillospiraceae bacterium]|nr:hypothetical protein [Oscillospiraceae bacterium]